jgi:hypothetical protein
MDQTALIRYSVPLHQLAVVLVMAMLFPVLPLVLVVLVAAVTEDLAVLLVLEAAEIRQTHSLPKETMAATGQFPTHNRVAGVGLAQSAQMQAHRQTVMAVMAALVQPHLFPAHL